MPSRQTNPQPELLETIDYGQIHLIHKLQEYLNLRHRKNPKKYSDQMPFDQVAGWCSGLAAYWLYLKRIDAEDEFFAQINYILQWDGEDFKQENTKQEDEVFEAFYNNILFLFHDKQIRNVERSNINESLSFLLPKSDSKVPAIAPTEYSISFVFNQDTLANLFELTVKDHKMVRFGNAFHTISMYKDGDVYYVFNPTSSKLISICDSSDSAAQAVIAALAPHCFSKEYIALNMSIFDLSDSKPTAYEYTPLEYCAELLNYSDHKAAVFSHPNLLRVCMLYKHTNIVDLLYANGYKYVKSDLYFDNELGCAVSDHRTEDIEYLLAHGLSLESYSEIGESAVGAAISFNLLDMLYKLLQLGANPNALVAKNVTALDLALTRRNPESITLLLAAGAECPPESLSCMKFLYQEDGTRMILEHAAILSEKFYHANKNSLGKMQITSKAILDLLGTAAKKITSNNMSNATDDDLQAMAVILTTLQEISANNAGLNPTKIYMRFRAMRIHDKISKYLKKEGYGSINEFLNSLNKTPAKRADPIRFLRPTTPVTTEIQFERDILPLLKLR